MTNIQSKLKTRRQRRLDAKEAGAPFQPQYSSGVRYDKGRKLSVGGAPRTFEEVYRYKQGEPKPKEVAE